jgi:hypothetical protein
MLVIWLKSEIRATVPELTCMLGITRHVLLNVESHLQKKFNRMN